MGVAHTIVDWDDPSIDWSGFDAVIIRSTWNYHQQSTAFARWVDHVGSVARLHNPAPIVRWNLDKRYLADVEQAGLPVIATKFIDDVVVLNATSLDGDVMVKPTVGAGSNDTARFIHDPVAARAHALRILHADKAVMVQPYLASIDTFGETGLVYFNGVFSHAFCKGAIFATDDAEHNGLYVEEEIGERIAGAHERLLGDRVMAFVEDRFGQTPLYARVDLVSASATTAQIMEIELIEPSLFLHTDRGAADRFGRVIKLLMETD